MTLRRPFDQLSIQSLYMNNISDIKVTSGSLTLGSRWQGQLKILNIWSYADILDTFSSTVMEVGQKAVHVFAKKHASEHDLNPKARAQLHCGHVSRWLRHSSVFLSFIGVVRFAFVSSV